MLYILGGLPGTGKSTLAKHLASTKRAAWIRIDTIEQQLRNGGIANLYNEGYKVGFAQAIENLQIGMPVVADSTNSVTESRIGWINAAQNSDVNYLEIEVICSDSLEHRRRVETRITDISGLVLPDWQSVIQREYHPWHSADIVIDTAGQTPEQSLALLLKQIQLNS